MFSKNEDNVQVKLFEYERKVIELQRFINEITLSKTSVEKQV